MTLLVISPDYASHLLPLATLATSWRDAGESVVVATGPATAGIVADFGFDRAELVLGRGSNPGVIRAEQQPPGEDAALRGFFAATRHGMVPTLRYQAEARRTDLLWEPADTCWTMRRDDAGRWTPDWAEVQIGKERDFNGIKAPWVGQLDMKKAGAVADVPPYEPMTIARESRLGWDKGTTVMILDDADGNARERDGTVVVS